MKQNWKDFILWVCKESNITDWKLEKAKVHYSWVFSDKRRRDLDNLVMHIKIINDGFTNAGVWVDDCLGRIELELDTGLNIEKDNPRIVIEIEEIVE